MLTRRAFFVWQRPQAMFGNICALYLRSSYFRSWRHATACIVKPIRSHQETAMKLKSKSATKFAALLAAAATISIGIDAAPSGAAPRTTPDDRGSVYYYGPRGPNISYQSGPHTRIYVTKRSWLDAGTEVVPGDRKFTDYAFPPGYSFGQGNMNRSLYRQPLNPASDMGGLPRLIPLY
jgi:hypothetical protein